MVELSGELVAYPCPNKQGLWAYLKFADGTLLEVELTREEWFALHERHRTKELDKIRKLHQHPLNQVSKKLLGRAKEYPLPNEIYFDLPGQIRSRVNDRLDRNQGGHGHAQETVYARRDYSTSADG